MEHTRFDRLVTSLGSGASRRGVLQLLAGAGGGGLAMAAGLSATDAKKKKKRCKPRASGAPCSSDKQCCTKKTKRICEVPQDASSSDTVCCGGEGAPCGGVNIDGDALAPKCCIGSAGVRSFVCSQNDPGTPNTPGTCVPAP